MPGSPMRCDAFAGSGIVYALTVAETERLAGFLRSCGFEVAAYHGGLDTAVRQRIEDALRRNALKAVVATSALGMGYDKPDLAFCIHVGSPASPVAYYQQVGRAGRALDDAVAVLLPAETDERIWAYFATAGVPDESASGKILGALAQAAADPGRAGERHRDPPRAARGPAEDPGRRRGGAARRLGLGAHRQAVDVSTPSAGRRWRRCASARPA